MRPELFSNIFQNVKLKHWLLDHPFSKERTFLTIAFLPLLVCLAFSSPDNAECSFPPGCKPPELRISSEHPLIILYSPGTGERTVKCWQNLPSKIKPYCAVTMDPSSVDVKERLEGWRR